MPGMWAHSLFWEDKLEPPDLATLRLGHANRKDENPGRVAVGRGFRIRPIVWWITFVIGSVFW